VWCDCVYFHLYNIFLNLRIDGASVIPQSCVIKVLLLFTKVKMAFFLILLFVAHLF
jgi:hypothetical protein